MLIALVGQTASGKSSLGIELARTYPKAAILGLDAMQLYQGLDIGTAKTPVAQRFGIPHYQIDQLRVDQEAAVATYQDRARADVNNLQQSEIQVIAVGGSGLYARALLDQMVFPGVDSDIRSKLEDEMEQKGADSLYRRLSALDPESARRIHPHNGRRIIRALEVIELTGKPYTATLPIEKYFYPQSLQMAIRWDEDELDQRINLRTKAMFSDGIVEETKNILDRGLEFGRTAAKATGYSEALAIINGQMSVAEAVDQVALSTRQLARRQMKWFKRDQRIHWLDPRAQLSLLAQAQNVIEQANA